MSYLLTGESGQAIQAEGEDRGMTNQLSSPKQRPVLNLRSSHSFRSFRQTILGFLVLVAIAFGGAVDAIACSPEGISGSEAISSVSTALVDDQGPAEDEKRSPDQHAVCAHGHCHHGQQATAMPTGAAQTLAGSNGPVLADDDYLSDNQPDLLKRPPRA